MIVNCVADVLSALMPIVPVLSIAETLITAVASLARPPTVITDVVAAEKVAIPLVTPGLYSNWDNVSHKTRYNRATMYKPAGVGDGQG